MVQRSRGQHLVGAAKWKQVIWPGYGILIIRAVQSYFPRRALQEGKSRRDAMSIEKIQTITGEPIYGRKVFGCAPKGAPISIPVWCSINISPLRGFFSDGLLTDSRSRREELAGVTHRPPPIIKNSSAPKFRSETSHEPFNQERKS